MAAGTLTVTSRLYTDARITKYTLDWVSDGSGDCNGHTTELAVIQPGYLRQIKFVPNTTDLPVSDLYDVTLLDGNGIDLLAGVGANLSGTISTFVVPTAQIFRDGESTLDLVVTNAASGIPFGAGVISLWFRL